VAADDAEPGQDRTADGDTSARLRAERLAAAAQRELVAFEVPSWLRTVGIGCWLVLGIVALVLVIFGFLGLVAEVAIPLAIAAVLAAILVPITDRLVLWHVPRWLAATLVLLLGLSIVIGTIAAVIAGITSQADEIWQRLQEGLASVNSDGGGTQAFAATLNRDAHSVVSFLTSGALGSLVSSAGGLVVSAVLALFILLFLLKDWRQITSWVAGHVGLPAPVGARILDGTVDAFRGYALGLTIIGLANAAVVGLAALILRVPLVGTITLVTFVTSYVPYIGAFVAGAFAVLIGYGSGGIGVALVMLAVVLLANNTIQNLLEPFAFGARLRLHPLVVLITVTGGTMLFGIMGAILAAPLTAASVKAYHDLRGTNSGE
jgi:predicted PurR-regulated permease PerM